MHEALIHSTEELLETLTMIPDDKGDYAYAEGKWTIKQLLIHISDAERIFAYRLLRFARNDQQQPLPFEEDDYAKTSNADKRSLSSVIEELIAVRNATASLIESLQPEDFNKQGNTAAGKTTVERSRILHLRTLQSPHLCVKRKCSLGRPHAGSRRRSRVPAARARGL